MKIRQIRISVLAAFAATAFCAYGDVQLPAFNGYVTGTPQVAFRNVNLDELTRFYACVEGVTSAANATGSSIGWYSRGRFVKRNADGSLSVQFAVEDNRFGQIKAVKVVFAQSGDDVTVVADYAKFTGVTAANTVETFDFDNGGNNGTVKTSPTSGGYGISKIIAYRAGHDRVSFPFFLLSTAQSTGWNAGDVSRLTDFRAVLTGGYAKFPQTALGFFGSTGEGAASVQLQSFQDMYPMNSDNYTRSAKLELASSGEDITVSVPSVKFRGGKLADALKTLPGMVDMDTAGTEQTLAVTEKGVDIALRDLTARKRNAVDFGEYPGWLQTTETVLWKNRKLADIAEVSASMGGGSSGANGPRGVYNVKYDADAGVLTAQIQNHDGNYVKCVGMEFRQSGDDITGKAAYARFWADNTMNSPAYLGYDFDVVPYNEYSTIAVGPGSGGYGAFAVSMVARDETSGAIEWTGEGDGSSWADPANWKGNAVPSATDTVQFFNGVVPVTVTGSEPFPTPFIETYSGFAPVTFVCPMNFAGDFEPLVSRGGITVSNLVVGGTFAPQGRGVVRLEGVSDIARLSPGNAVRRLTGLEEEFGFQSALVYEVGGSGENAIGEISGLDILPKEILRVSGTNTVGSPLMMSKDAVFAVADGMTEIPDLMPVDGNVSVNVAEGAELAVNAFTNRYLYPVTFGGAGRVSFGAYGYPLHATNRFDGVTIGTCGSDYTFSGAVTSSTDTVTVSPADADGTARTIEWTGAVLGDAALAVTAGGVLALGEGAALNAVNVGSGCRLSVAGAATASALSVEEGGALVLGDGGCLDLSDVDVDFSAIPLFAAVDAVRGTPVLKARSFVSVPSCIVEESAPEKRYQPVVSGSDGFAVLSLRKYPKGLTVSIR